MLKNDFRRSLILLRPLRRGMSGHVRLERRTLQGSMRFTVQGTTQGKLHALLLAQAAQGFTVYKLGALTTDSRGQSGLTATFDPRNLQGLDLNQYTLVALVDDGAVPEMVLSGLVNGSKEIDWAAATQAAIAPYQKPAAVPEAVAQGKTQAAQPVEAAEQARQTPVQEQACCCGQGEAQPANVQAAAEAIPADPAAEPAQCCCDVGDKATADEQAPVLIVTKTVEVADGPAQPQAGQQTEQQPAREAVPAQEAESAREAEPVLEAVPAPEAESARETEPVLEAVPAQEAESARETEPALEGEPAQEDGPMACVLLALDLTLTWPEEIAALKPLFEQNPASDNFALEDFVFVDAPLPAEDGAQGQCAIGLKARDGVPVSVCYALPGDFSLEPPPGLEGYQYLGGWWFTVLEAQPEVNALGETLGDDTAG